jgi:hypothetical protein
MSEMKVAKHSDRSMAICKRVLDRAPTRPHAAGDKSSSRITREWQWKPPRRRRADPVAGGRMEQQTLRLGIACGDDRDYWLSEVLLLFSRVAWRSCEAVHRLRALCLLPFRTVALDAKSPAFRCGSALGRCDRRALGAWTPKAGSNGVKMPPTRL